MGDKSDIEWTDATWNPTTGCTKLSDGCKNCYAKREWARLSANPKTVYFGRKFEDVRCHPERLDYPLHLTKPRMIFVDSMSDLFHEDVPDEFIDCVFAVMGSSRHMFQVLTKRAERMRAYMQRVADGAAAAGQRYESEMRAHFDRYSIEFREGYSLPKPPTPELRFIYDSAARQENRPTSPDGTTLRYGFSGGEFHWRKWPLQNVWLGVSAEDQKTFDERVEHLGATPAAVRFVSCEPLLEEIDTGNAFDDPTDDSDYGKINWVIAGGESGPSARPSHPDWFRSLRDQCAAAGVPFFFKQWGEWAPQTVACSSRAAETALYISTDGATRPAAYGARNGAVTIQRVGKRAAGHLLDGREHSEFPLDLSADLEGK